MNMKLFSLEQIEKALQNHYSSDIDPNLSSIIDKYAFVRVEALASHLGDMITNYEKYEVESSIVLKQIEIFCKFLSKMDVDFLKWQDAQKTKPD